MPRGAWLQSAAHLAELTETTRCFRSWAFGAAQVVALLVLSTAGGIWLAREHLASDPEATLVALASKASLARPASEPAAEPIFKHPEAQAIPAQRPPSATAKTTPDLPEPASTETAGPAPIERARIEMPVLDEARLLESAREALATAPQQALQHLGSHATRFPSGRLSLEREALTIMTLCRLGRRDEALGRAKEIEKDFPRTKNPYRKQIDELIEQSRSE
jgi:hypothetical protein